MSISFAIRPFRQEDLPAVLELFWETVHTVNADAYSAGQLDAWAPADPDIQAWKTSLAAHRAYVAVDDADKLVGFGDIVQGHIDRLYVRGFLPWPGNRQRPLARARARCAAPARRRGVHYGKALL